MNETGHTPFFKLRVIQAKYGDSLLLEYGEETRPHAILIDGGPDGVYAAHLKPEMEALIRRGGKLDLMALSHVDEDHVVGLVDLLSDVAGGGLPLKIDRLWHNTFRNALGGADFSAESFLSTVEEGAFSAEAQPVAYSIKQGEDLWKGAMILHIPLNLRMETRLVELATAPRPVDLEGLKLWVIGPAPTNLERLRVHWKAWFKKYGRQPFGPTASAEALAIDNSYTNRSSMMFLVEAAGRRMLLTGDGRWDDILAGLKETGWLEPRKPLHVDVFKVPHHGSKANNRAELYRRVTADVYVIPAGEHKDDNNPDFDTLDWIVTSAHDAGRKIELVITNGNQNTDRLLAERKPETYGYRLRTLAAGEHSLVV